MYIAVYCADKETARWERVWSTNVRVCWLSLQYLVYATHAICSYPDTTSLNEKIAGVQVTATKRQLGSRHQAPSHAARWVDVQRQSFTAFLLFYFFLLLLSVFSFTSCYITVLLKAALQNMARTWFKLEHCPLFVTYFQTVADAIGGKFSVRS
jgi:hypothetical protein